MVESPVAFTMSNGTMSSDLPPLPDYTISPIPDFLPWVSDFWLSVFAPHVAYWLVSMCFHIIDVYDMFPQYRLHTPEEIAQRNLASRWQVARDVILEQIIQCFTAAVLSLTEPAQMTGMENYDVAVWATRIRLAQRAFPTILGLLGLNAAVISKSMSASHPLLAGVLAGGHYPFLTTSLAGTADVAVPAFATWELMLAKAIYWGVIPLFQMWIAVVFLDTWQYFWHRAMHVNKWMYSMSSQQPEFLFPPVPLSFWQSLTASQHTGTQGITDFTFPTHTAPYTTTRSKASCWIPQEPVLLTRYHSCLRRWAYYFTLAA